MVLGIGGGIGSGVFAFHYAKENFSSFYIAGRHQWQDGLAFIRPACDRLGVTVAVSEAGGAKAAESQLRDYLSRRAGHRLG